MHGIEEMRDMDNQQKRDSFVDWVRGRKYPAAFLLYSAVMTLVKLYTRSSFLDQNQATKVFDDRTQSNMSALDGNLLKKFTGTEGILYLNLGCRST